MALVRKRSEVARDRRVIGRMYLKGATQMAIAAELGISQATVSNDLKHIQAEWQAANIADIDRRKREELAKIDALELEYWDAWARSCENAEVETTKMVGSSPEKPDRAEKTKRVEGQAGDPRFLAGVQWCIERRCKLLGIDAPHAVDLTSAGKAIAIRVIYEDASHATDNGDSSTG